MLLIFRYFDFLPESVVESLKNAYSVYLQNFVGFIVFIIGLSALDFSNICNAVTWYNMMLILIAVIGACFGAFCVAKVLKMSILDNVITGGLCMTDMGGSGDVTVLSVSGRLHLMVYATLASRIGGVMVLFLVGLLVK